ncbi:receptor-type tyrosine-protein phosphatase N2-like [Ornithodoros turicata]
MLPSATFLLVLIAARCTADSSVGCFFVENICEDEEVCFDDGLFGRCESAVQLAQQRTLWRPELSHADVKLLESELERLWVAGYRWHHVYSQCVIRSALGAIKHQRLYDPGFCARTLRTTLPVVTDEIAMELEHLGPGDMAFIKFTPNVEVTDGISSQFADEVFFPPLSKSAEEALLQGTVALQEPENKPEQRSATLPELKEVLKNHADKRRQQGYLIGSDGKDSEDSEDEELALGLLDYLRQMDKDTASFLDENTGRYDVFTPPDVPVVETELSSDLDQRPVLMEDGAIEWIPVEGRNEESSDDPGDSAIVLPESVREDSPQIEEILSVVAEQRSDRSGESVPSEKEASQASQNAGGAALESPSSKWDSDAPTWKGSAEEKPLQLGWMDFVDDAAYSGSPADETLDISVRQDPAFRRPMRYDIKKPGPTYFYHEPESSETSMENAQKLQKIMLMQEKLNARTPEDISKEDAVLDHLKEVGQSTGKRYEAAYRRVPHEDRKGSDEVGPKSDGSPDNSVAYVVVKENPITQSDADRLVIAMERVLRLPSGTLSNTKVDGSRVTLKVNPNALNLNASTLAAKTESLRNILRDRTNLTVVAAGTDGEAQLEVIRHASDGRLLVATVAICGSVAAIVVAGSLVYLLRRHARSKEKLQSLAQSHTEPSQDYQDLCRQRMAAKNHEKSEPMRVTAQSPKRVSSLSQSDPSQPGSRSSTSSWSEEPVTSNMDISTGHMILTYMEDHLKCKDRLDREWEALCAYEADPSATATAAANMKKNRYPDVLPYDHSRVVLNDLSNMNSSDYINASTITDHDPRNPAYIATQGPLPHTAADFWQMIWEQGSVVIVMLSRLMEDGVAMCHRYWPEEGSEVYHNYEVHLVSEHIWCDDYLVRSFYLKNLKTSETRTVTQFHFLSWPDNGIPSSIKAILEFRRKVNKSYRGRSCPIVVHCSDGIGRTGTYCLIDMVLNRMAKGAKEIDIAATLEHLRDQRAGMVKTKAQFEFVLMAIAEEVHAILKALSH